MIKHLTILFLIGLVFWGCEECDDSLTNELMEFADNNWSLESWVYNRFNPPTNLVNNESWANFPELNSLIVTHSLQLIANDVLIDELGGMTIVSSDSLENNPGWVESVTLVRDEHFYNNIKDYNQFFGGWSDSRDGWNWGEENMGDSIRIGLTTPKRKQYVEMFPNCD